MSLLSDNGASAKFGDFQKISCSSQVLSEDYTFTWKMNNFGRIPFISKYPIYGPTFTLGKRSDSLWQVMATKHMHYPKEKKSPEDDDSEGEPEVVSVTASVKSGEASVKSEQRQPKKSIDESELIKRIGFRLIKLDETSTWEALKIFYTLKGSSGAKYETEIREEPGLSEYDSRCSYTYITEDDKDTSFIFNESDIVLVVNITFKYIEGSPFEAPEVCEGKSCADDLRLLYNSKKFSDVILVVEGAEIAAHKSILCARAYGFKKFLNDYKEDSQQMVDLKVDADVAKALVRFMYCGGIKEDFPVSKCLDLYEAALTYGVSNLKKRCSRFFKSHLDQNVCRKCLGVDENVEDWLEEVRKLPSKKWKRVISNVGICGHKAASERLS